MQRQKTRENALVVVLIGKGGKDGEEKQLVTSLGCIPFYLQAPRIRTSWDVLCVIRCTLLTGRQANRFFEL